MTITIHETALVDPKAELDTGVSVGPYCVIGKDVKIGKGTSLQSHVVIDGHTTIGEENQFFPFSSIGQVPQDLKYKGEPTSLVIGNRNVIRESVTMSIGTAGGGGQTTVGDDNLFMGLVHLGHDSLVANSCVLAQGATLAGHVELENHVVIGGMSAVHQFVHIGEHAMIGGMTPVVRDVLPYCTAVGGRGDIASLNLIGLRRRGFSRDAMRVLKEAFDYILTVNAGSFDDRLLEMCKKYPDTAELQKWHTFVARSKRGIASCADGGCKS